MLERNHEARANHTLYARTLALPAERDRGVGREVKPFICRDFGRTPDAINAGASQGIVEQPSYIFDFVWQ